MESYDVVVLGAGPGGGAAAQRADLRGARVCLVEPGPLGGCCLNVGCIPTKAMLHASELYHLMCHRAGEFGIFAGDGSYDGEALMKRVHDVVETIVAAMDRKYEKNEIDLLRGRGRLSDANTVEVSLNDGGRQVVRGDNIVIATGSQPIRPGMFPWDSPRVITTDDAVRARTVPESILIVGGGVIGCEFATFYSELGVETTIVEMLDRLSPAQDEDVSKAVRRALRRRGVTFHLSTRVEEMTADDEGISASLDSGRTVRAAVALIGVGRQANLDDLGLDAAGVESRDGIIPVDDHCRTNVRHIYGVGDCAELRQYAHLASRMGVVAGDNATGHDATDDLNAVPIGQFTHPEVGSIGESEATAKENHERVRVARLQFQSTGTGWAYGEKEGLVKIIADASTGELYGGVVIGYHAVDVLQELALAKKHGLTVWQVFETIHTHPSFAEGVGLTAEDWVSEAIRGAREL